MNQNEINSENQVQVKKERDSNFELLRIFAMFLIIMSHQNQHGLWFSPNSSLTMNYFCSSSVFSGLGAIGNWLFIFVSGYFISENSFSWKKLFRLWFQVFSISALIGITTWISKIAVVPHWAPDAMETYNQQGFFAAARQMCLYDLITSFLPSYRSNNWFATAYMTFFLLMSTLGIITKQISQEEHKKLIIILSAITVVIPMLPGEVFFRPSSIGVFILGFFIAKYIRMYNPVFLEKTKRNILFGLSLYALGCLWAVFCTVFVHHITVPENYYIAFKSVFLSTNSLSTMLCALVIFCAFRSLKIPYSRFINMIASTTFGVYLIHENLLINKWWWHTVCKLDSFISSPLLLPYMILCALVTFAICTFLELLRKYCLEKPIERILTRRKRT